MGDICNMNDLERFMRSPDGKEYLEEIRHMLKGRTIVDVSFSNEVQYIVITLHLDDGDTYDLAQPSLDVDVLREEYADVLEREYYVDFPDRKPKEDEEGES